MDLVLSSLDPSESSAVWSLDLENTDSPAQITLSLTQQPRVLEGFRPRNRETSMDLSTLPPSVQSAWLAHLVDDLGYQGGSPKKVDTDNLTLFPLQTCTTDTASTRTTHDDTTYLCGSFQSEQDLCDQLFEQLPTDSSEILTPSISTSFTAVSDPSSISCAMCPTTFHGVYASGNLKRHLKSSHGGSKFVCEECGKEFKRADSRRSHYRKNHPELL
jgi:hypothetical protein